MNDADKKLLTEHLGERWRDKTVEDVFEWEENRDFTTRNDMMDLYEAIAKKGEWFDYYYHMFNKFARLMADISKGSTQQDFAAWLFCFNGQGYEERCQMVAEWLRKEASHE